MIKAVVLAISAITNVHDGDTFTVNMADCHVPVTCNGIPIRLRGYDAPELRDKRPTEKALAIKAKARLNELLGPGHRIELRNASRDKYYRLDADVISDGQDVGQLMATEGLLKPYTGVGPKPW